MNSINGTSTFFDNGKFKLQQYFIDKWDSKQNQNRASSQVADGIETKIRKRELKEKGKPAILSLNNGLS